jgi:O-antigen/teichoic acid export membrane protein
MPSAVRNLFSMGVSTGARLSFGMLSFVVMARALGPTDFGQLMIWLSICTLLALIANFGLAPYLLREIGIAPQSANLVMGEVLTAKLLLSGVVITIALCGAVLVKTASLAVFFLLLGAMLIESTTEFLNVRFRATNRYAEEARIATVATMLQFAVIALAVWLKPSISVAAFAYFLSRTLVLSITWYAQRRHFDPLRLGSLRSALRRIRSTVAYAIDLGLQSLFGQIDSLVLNHYVGPSAVGVFQAGMRVVLGGAQAASILGNVFLPRAAAAAVDPVRFQRESRLVQTAFVGTGAFVGLVLASCSELITQTLFGPEFSELVELLPWFGLLFFVRFIAASWGVVLTAAGKQGFRAWINTIQWGLVAILAAMLVPRFATIGWLMTLVAGNAFLGIAYFSRGIQLVRPRALEFFMIVTGVLAFLPFLQWPAALL